MASKRRLRRNACLGKIRYAAQLAATRAAAALYFKAGQRVRAYHCPHCAGWHVGHPMRGKAKHRAA